MVYSFQPLRDRNAISAPRQNSTIDDAADSIPTSQMRIVNGVK